MLIGVTTTVVPEAGAHARPQISLYAAYIAVLERLGIAAALLTPAHGNSSIEALLAGCQGLVLTGGEDVDPSRYGEEPIPELGTVNPARDAMELSAVRVGMRRRMPILGICRGCQVLNVALGGTLYQDLDTQHPGERRLHHRQREPWGQRSHEARVEPGSTLHEIIGRDDIFINSYHHQAIRQPGQGLEVVALAEDGLIEAVEATDYPWMIGVQWHPERHEAHAPDSDPDLRLFAAFRDAAAEFGGRG